MDNTKKYGFFICTIISLLLGAIVFIYFFGYKIINPFYIDWIFHSHPDLRETFVGWNYFQHSPWVFPLGVYNSLSYPVKTSILNTDSIPLFAIFFKLFKNILPDDFQYFGIYVLICYMLQSFFGMAIVRRFCKNDFLGNLIAIISGLFFVLMPSITLKAFWHTTSVYHFILIACFIPVIYKFSLKQNIFYYSFIGFLASSTQPYILVIDWIVLLFYCIYLYINKNDFKQFLPLISYSLVAFFILYIIGAFLGTSVLEGKHLLTDSFNLNAFFNSMAFMKFFNFDTYSGGQTQGYAYFGLGSLIVIFLSLIGFVIQYFKNNFKFKYKKETCFIFILVFTSIIIALSPRVTFGNNILFEIPYPDFIIKFWSIFRCTGRFIWITNYIILSISLCYVVKYFSKKICIFILIICLGLQLYDFIPMQKEKEYLKNELSYKYEGHPELIEAIKDKVIDHIYFDKNIYDFVDIKGYGSDLIQELACFARNKDIKFNSFYFARTIRGLDEKYFNELNNPSNKDAFIFLQFDYNSYALASKTLKYFYLYQYIIVASNVEIDNLKKYKATREFALDTKNRLKRKFDEARM